MGEVLGEVGDPDLPLGDLVSSSTSPVSRSVCLGYIDPAGDTVFNQLQIPDLIQELRIARDGIANQRISEHLDIVIALAERASVVHTYLWFHGD